MKTTIRTLGSIICLIICQMAAITALAEVGPGGGNGGDLECDAEIRKIVGNPNDSGSLHYWIENNGAEIGPLDLSSSQFPVKNAGLAKPYSFNEYKASMLNLLAKPLISSCVSSGDKAYPVAIGDSSKICVSKLEIDGFHLRCDAVKFLGMDQDHQIQQIHHEFATNVPGLEPDRGPISTYRLSTQLGKFTVTIAERRLGLVSGKQTSAEIIQDDSQVFAQLRVRGGHGSLAEEIYNDLKLGPNDNDRQETEVTAISFHDSTIYQASQKGGKTRVQANSNADESTFEATVDIESGYIVDVQNQVKKGLIEISNRSLYGILRGSPNESRSGKPAILGKFIRCTEDSCKIFLKGSAKSEQVEAKNCEFYIDRAAKVNPGNNLVNNGPGRTLLVAKVRSDLAKQISGITYVASRLDPDDGISFRFLPLSNGHFYLADFITDDCPTGGNGCRDLPRRGYFLLELKDGRTFALHQKNGENFVLDTRFSASLRTEMSEASANNKVIQIIPRTADLYDTDGSARYINPYKCF
ncbi:MAG: hypothetical protein ACXWRE_11075 [Pseudobdellovibrionaceae bacterium]